MDYASGMTIRDLPVPPSIDQSVREFGASVFTLVAQPHLGEASYGTVGSNGTLVELSLSYCLYRHPDNLEDPSNFIDEIDSIRTAIDDAKANNQPAWFLESLLRMKYPMLWEAVCTVKLGPDPDCPLAERLADHVNHVLINTVESRRHMPSGAPPTLDHEVTARHAQPGFTLNIDGTDVDALLIDTDPDVIGWAAEIGDCAVLIAINRDISWMLDLRLERRQPSDESG